MNEQESITSRAKALYDGSFTTTGRSAVDPQAVSLMVKFATAETKRREWEIIQMIRDRENDRSIPTDAQVHLSLLADYLEGEL